jgi:hypothetical protein
MQLIVLLLLLMCGGALSSSSLASSIAGTNTNWKRQADGSLHLTGNAGTDLEVLKINYVKRPLDGRWVLKLRHSEGMLIRAAGEMITPEKALSEKSFARLLTFALQGAKEIELPPSHIHIDIGLVDEFRTEAKQTVGRANCKQHSQERYAHCLTRWLERALRESKAVERVCISIREAGWDCSRNRVNMNPVVLRRDMAGASTLKGYVMDIDEMWLSVDLTTE